MANQRQRTIFLAFLLVVTGIIFIEAARLEILTLPRSRGPLTATLACQYASKELNRTPAPGPSISPWFRIVSFELATFSSKDNCFLQLHAPGLLHIGEKNYYVKVVSKNSEIDLVDDNVDSGLILNQEMFVQRQADGLRVNLSAVPIVPYERRVDILVSTSLQERWDMIWDFAIGASVFTPFLSSNRFDGLYRVDDAEKSLWWLNPRSGRFVSLRTYDHPTLYEFLLYHAVAKDDSLPGDFSFSRENQLAYHMPNGGSVEIENDVESARRFVERYARRIDEKAFSKLRARAVKKTAAGGFYRPLDRSDGVWYLHPVDARWYYLSFDTDGFFTLQYIAHSIEHRELTRLRAGEEEIVFDHGDTFLMDEETNELFYVWARTKELFALKNIEDFTSLVKRRGVRKLSDRLFQSYASGSSWIWEPREAAGDTVQLFVNGQQVGDANSTLRPTDTIEIANESIRAIYPFPRLGSDEQADWNYYRLIDGVWTLVNAKLFGDYSYFVDAIRNGPYDIRVETLKPDEVRIRTRSGTYSGSKTFEKTVMVKRDVPGVFVRYRSDPPNPEGEREMGFRRGFPYVYSEGGNSMQYVAAFPEEKNYLSLIILPYPMQTQRLAIDQYVERSNHDGFVFFGYIPFDASGITPRFTTSRRDGFLDVTMSVPEDGTYLVGADVLTEAGLESNVILAAEREFLKGRQTFAWKMKPGAKEMRKLYLLPLSCSNSQCPREIAAATASLLK